MCAVPANDFPFTAADREVIGNPRYVPLTSPDHLRAAQVDAGDRLR
jgi:hypothetical protein